MDFGSHNADYFVASARELAFRSLERHGMSAAAKKYAERLRLIAGLATLAAGAMTWVLTCPPPADQPALGSADA